MSPNPLLERVRLAVAAKTSAEQEYRSALIAAYEAGLSYAAIARAAGVSRQSVRQLLAGRV